ncbi:hypothetical protein [Geofilum rubicundum]|uniref:hypothetical protein n=1 Tax=Geofilum rubicundum TaxID=472113 RepID=UPI0034E267BF
MQRSPWPGRLEMVESDFRPFSQQSHRRFDLIVSNPPYFIDSKPAAVASRSVARHTSHLSYTDLIEASCACLRWRANFLLFFRPKITCSFHS